jgi:hypothetical protein
MGELSEQFRAGLEQKVMTNRHMPDALFSLNDPRKSAIKIGATAVDDVRNPWELPWLRLQLRDRRRTHALDDDPRDHWHRTAGVHPGRHRDATAMGRLGLGYWRKEVTHTPGGGGIAVRAPT